MVETQCRFKYTYTMKLIFVLIDNFFDFTEKKRAHHERVLENRYVHNYVFVTVIRLHVAIPGTISLFLH